MIRSEDEVPGRSPGGFQLFKLKGPRPHHLDFDLYPPGTDENVASIRVRTYPLIRPGQHLRRNVSPEINQSQRQATSVEVDRLFEAPIGDRPGLPEHLLHLDSTSPSRRVALPQVSPLQVRSERAENKGAPGHLVRNLLLSQIGPVILLVISRSKSGNFPSLQG